MENNSVKKNIVLNVIYTVTNIIFPLLTFPYASRILLADGIGKVSFFFSLSNYAIIIASFGISTYGVRAISNARDSVGKRSQVAIELFIINISLSILVITFIVLMSLFFKELYSEEKLLFINCIVIISSSIGMSWFFFGLEQYSYITKRTIFFKLVSLALVFLLVKTKSDYNLYAGIMAFSIVGPEFINFIYIRKFIRLKGVSNLRIRCHLKAMLFLFISYLSVGVYTNLDTVILGLIKGNAEVGIYSVAIKAKLVLLTLINAASSALLPRMSYYASNNSINEMYKIIKWSISIIFFIAIPFSVFFILESKDAVLLFGGEEYLEAYLSMVIVMPILVISGFSNILANQILLPNNKDIYFTFALLAGAIINILLNVFLIPALGAIGAAFSTLAAEITQMSIQTYFSKEYIRGNINWSSLYKVLFSSLLAMLIVYFLNLSGGLLFSFIFSGFLFFLLYITLLLLLKDELIITIKKYIFHK